MTSQNILVPVDLDDESTWRKPLSTAVEYVGWAGGKVHVITVVPNEMIGMTVVTPAHWLREVGERKTGGVAWNCEGPQVLPRANVDGVSPIYPAGVSTVS